MCHFIHLGFQHLFLLLDIEKVLAALQKAEDCMEETENFKAKVVYNLGTNALIFIPGALDAFKAFLAL